MMTQQTLAILALATSVVSMLLSMVALWPQWRDQFAVLRDVVLWAALAVVVIGLVSIGWQQSSSSKPREAEMQPPMDYASVLGRNRLQPNQASGLAPQPYVDRGRDFLAPIQR